jgi:general secretion pathway protein D
MAKKNRFKYCALIFAALLVCLAFAAFPQNVKAEEMKEVALDFDDVDIRLFIRVISEMTGKNFIIDNNVRGKVTVLSPKRLTTQQAYEVFKSVLSVNGFTVVEAGQVVKIVPAQNMSGYELPLGTKKVLKGDDEYITQIMPLKHLDANGLVALVKPLLSRNGAVFAPPSSDLLVVTDYRSNIKKVDNLLDEIDLEITDATVEKMDLKYSTAELVSAKLTEILEAKYGKGRKGTRQLFFKVVPIERINAIIGVASADILMDIRNLVQKIDSPTPEGKSLINVYYLDHAKAEDLVRILTDSQKTRAGTDIPTRTMSQTGTIGASASAARSTGAESIPRTEGGGSIVGGKFKAFGKEISITADKSTNSIIVYAEPDDYIAIKEMIQKLDLPRKQVFIEALIMEVSPEENFKFGGDWYAGTDTDNPMKSGTKAGVFGSAFSGSDLANLSTKGAVAFGQGLSLGVIGEAIKLGDITFPTLGVLIRAMETVSTVNILSKPQLMTLNNEKATINISTNLPFQTTSTILEGGGTAQNFEYRDVGIKLDIVPRINKKGKVTLEIKQEVSKIVPGTTTDFKPTTLKRAIDTVVEVNDGSTIVIGGLIEDQKNFSDGAVPCLGGIPFLGWAFKNVNNSSSKTNLLVFISPKVFESSGEAEGLTKEKRDYMDMESLRQLQQMDQAKPWFKEPKPGSSEIKEVPKK